MTLAPLPPGFRQATYGDRLAAAAAELRRRGPEHDHDGADPTLLCAPLAEHGLFLDALPDAFGGCLAGQDPRRLHHALMTVGAADLSAGRIFEGHVNAIKLVFRYGAPAQQRALAEDVAKGAVCGVWNAEAPPGLTLDRLPSPGAPGRLTGAKIFASGIGLVSRPVVTPRLPGGGLLMLAPRLTEPPPHDLSRWRVRGMRATATGTVDFTGIGVEAEAVIGAPDDYYRSPLFKGGAWRFAAVQAGAVQRLTELFQDALRLRGRDADPHQKARLGQAALAAETAELWTRRAALFAEDPASDPATADAYVNLARLAVERAALEAVSLVERGLGLAAFTRPSEVDRVVRDLTTYLRQPFPDGALDDAAAFLGRTDGPAPWSTLAEEAP